jgi:CheY-like chemotaxis protein
MAQHAATAAGSTLSSAAAAATHAATHVGTQAGAALSSAAAAALPMTANAPAATVLPHVTLQPNVETVTDRTVDRILSDKPDKLADSGVEKPVIPPSSGATPLSPSALAAAVAPSATRTNLRVVPLPTASPLAASLPAAAKIVDAPIAPAAPAPAPAPAAAAPAPVVTPPPPVAPPVAAAPVTPVAPVAPTHTHTPRHEEHNFRVLAVDDSPLMRTFLQNKLQPYGIYPEFASSGEEALFKISKQHFDLIFLDVMLPGMDGYDVCKMIKKNKDNNLMKVVMLTSKDKTFDKIRGTMAGCDGYLTKPVDEIKLRAIIERHTVTRK